MTPARKQSRRPPLPRKGSRGTAPANTSRGRSRRQEKPAPRSRALDHLRRFVDGIDAVVPRVKKLFDDTSTAPPDNANKQTRFANKLDSLAADAEAVLSHYDAAFAEVAALPSAGKCSPADAMAKRLVTGFKAMRIGDQWRGQVDEMHRLATQARQPMSPEETRDLWDRLAKLVEGLGDILELAQNVRRKIDAHRKRFASVRTEDDLRRFLANAVRTTSLPDLKKIVAEFTPAFESLDQVDKALRDLLRGIGKVVAHQGKLTRGAEQAQESVIEQLDSVRLSLREFEEHARTFIKAIEDSKEYQAIVADGEGSPFAAVPKAVDELVAVMKARLDIALAWIEAIEKRQSTAFILPGYVGARVRDFAQQVRHARAQLDRYSALTPEAGQGGVPQAPAPDEGSFAGLGENERLVLRQILVAHERGEDGTTVQALVAATDLKAPTVRRILTRLGPALVTKAKQDRRGRQRPSSSPPDVYSVQGAARESCRRWLDAARNTP